MKNLLKSPLVTKLALMTIILAGSLLITTEPTEAWCQTAPCYTSCGEANDTCSEGCAYAYPDSQNLFELCVLHYCCCQGACFD